MLDTNSINAMIWRSRFVIYVLLFQSDGVEEVAKRSEFVKEAYGMQMAVDLYKLYNARPREYTDFL